MLFKTTFYESCDLSLSSKTTINFYENYEFTVAPMKKSSGLYYFQVEDVKGDFEITSIKNKCNRTIYYDKENKTFYYCQALNHSFTIVANIDLKTVHAAVYQLQIPYTRLDCLEMNEYFKDKIVLPGYDNMKFTYYARKFKNVSHQTWVEVQIKNPFNVRIQGKKGDFIFEQSLQKIDRELSFVVEQMASNDSDTKKLASKNATKSSSNNDEKCLKTEVANVSSNDAENNNNY